MERNIESFTAYITKYALSGVVYAALVEYDRCEFPDMVAETTERGFLAYYHGEGREWHRTKEGALAKAEKMRAAKITSLLKQIERLEKMTFTVEAARGGK